MVRQHCTVPADVSNIDLALGGTPHEFNRPPWFLRKAHQNRSRLPSLILQTARTVSLPMVVHEELRDPALSYSPIVNRLRPRLLPT